jgi:hypothetical protein
MNDFEFYMAFYGLLLGLSAATMLGRFADAIGARHRVRIGSLSAMLGVFLLLQMTAIWAWTWMIRATITVTWPALFEASLVSSGFYFGAALVFPRDISEWADLDVHYNQNKRVVATIVFCCAAIFTTQHLITKPALLTSPAWLAWSGLFYLPLLILIVSRSAVVDRIVLGILIAQLLAAGLGIV